MSDADIRSVEDAIGRVNDFLVYLRSPEVQKEASELAKAMKDACEALNEALVGSIELMRENQLPPCSIPIEGSFFLVWTGKDIEVGSYVNKKWQSRLVTSVSRKQRTEVARAIATLFEVAQEWMT